MKRDNIHLTISSTTPSAPADPETPRTLTYITPFTPGCPTDSRLYSQTKPSLYTPLSAFMTKPRSATTTTRRSSLMPSSEGPSTSFDSQDSDGSDLGGRVEQWRIRPGTFIVFELDTDFIVSSMKFEPSSRTDHEEETCQSVLDYPTGRYAGLVLWSHTYVLNNLDEYPDDEDLSGEVVEELIVNFVSPTRPPAPLQSHCVPIAPSSSTHRDIDTTPLQTTTLFPFSNLYQWTTLGTRLEVRTVRDSALRFALKEDEFERLDERVAVDFRELGRCRDSGRFGDEDWDAMRLQVPMHTVPVKVWRDVREAGRWCGGVEEEVSRKAGVAHPLKFVDEVEELVRSVLPSYSLPHHDSSGEDTV
ncbi:hypothetical protein BXZ70DRAFT_954010 [Cristinia sonorae]|uniref:Uncharacterized protein n=1 Tax=Cristinia sonorae TaxID=1940300 RepID=A0A8K0UGR2_9AGAR|nr:hypothetical protein BXZ70DRAFT_954010 [Cristinia sonorae]